MRYHRWSAGSAYVPIWAGAYERKAAGGSTVSVGVDAIDTKLHLPLPGPHDQVLAQIKNRISTTTTTMIAIMHPAPLPDRFRSGCGLSMDTTLCWFVPARGAPLVHYLPVLTRRRMGFDAVHSLHLPHRHRR
jgi:hypothetical protein